MKKNLRVTEQKVLKQLEIDSRMPLSAIARKIKKSQQQVSYTVNSLIEKEIIQKFCAIIDYSKFDIISFTVYFKVNYVSREKFEKLIDYIVSDMHTSWVVSCSGRYDLICAFLAQNPSQFNKSLKGMIAKFPKELTNYNVATTVVNRWFGRKYLFNGILIPKELIFGGDKRPEIIDEMDLNILNEISDDARKSSVKIAEKLALTPKTIINHIKNLQNKKVILGYKPLLNPRNMNYISRLLLIKYHNVSLELEDKLIEYLKLHPNVIRISKTLGGWDIEIEVEARNSKEYREVEMDIREKFSLLIQEIESFSLYKNYKRNYFPEFLMDVRKT